MPVRGPGLFKAIQRLTNNEVVDPSTPEKNSEAKRWPSFRKPTQAGGSATTQVQHSAVAKSSSARVTESVLRAELLALEEAWAMERAALLDQLAAKDETIWTLVRDQMSGPERLGRTPSFFLKEATGVDESAAAAPDVAPAAPPPMLIKRVSNHAVATLAAEQAEAEAANRAWQQASAHDEAPPHEDPPPQEDGAARDEPITELALERFEAALSELNHAAAATPPPPATGDAEAFRTGAEGAWSFASSCAEGALSAKGDASQQLLKGCVTLPHVHAPALFDALLRPENLQPLLEATLVSAHRVDERVANHQHTDGAGLDGHAPRDGELRNERFRVLLQPAFSWHQREMWMWRAVRRRPHKGTYLMVLANAPSDTAAGGRSDSCAPPAGPSAASTGASSVSQHVGRWLSPALQRRTKPANLIGENGLLVSHVELPGGVIGSRVCFVWCCEYVGNALSHEKIKATLSHFPTLARRMIIASQSAAPADHARRAELVDTNGDGNLDSLAVDTVGDGAVDMMISLTEVGMAKAGARAGGEPIKTKRSSLPPPARPAPEAATTKRVSLPLPVVNGFGAELPRHSLPSPLSRKQTYPLPSSDTQPLGIDAMSSASSAFGGQLLEGGFVASPSRSWLQLREDRIGFLAKTVALLEEASITAQRRLDGL